MVISMESTGLWITIWIGAITSAIVAFYIYSTWTYNTWKNLGIPGPKPTALFGNLGQLFSKGHSEYLAELVSTYGKVVGIYEGRTPVLLVTDTDILKEVTIKQFSNFINRKDLPAFDPPLNQSILVAQDEKWKQYRLMMTPFFSSAKLKQLSTDMNECASQLVKRLEELEGKPVSTAPVIVGFALTLASRVSFGIDVDSLRNKDDPIQRHAMALSESNSPLAALAFMFPSVMQFLRKYFGVRLFNKEPLTFFRAFIQKILKERQTSGSNKQTQNVNKPQFLDAMMQSQENDSKYPKLNTEELVAQALVFYLNGTDTTAYSLAFLCYFLATNPDVQQKLQAKVDDIIGSEETVTPELCAEVPYIRQCINETLRLCPPFKSVDRTCANDVTIKGVHIPAGCIVSAPIEVMQRDPDVWDQPDSFRPERFDPEVLEGREHPQYMPFGAGPRNCIGRRLALMVMDIALVKIMQKFTIKTSRETEVLKLMKSFLTRPLNPIMLVFERRST